MYLPSLEKRTSDMEDMISEKKEREDGSSSCSNSAQTLASGSYKAIKEYTFSVLITKRTLTHICQLNRAFGACVHKPVAALRVEFGSGDDLRKLFHIRRLDIDNVEALILNVQVP